MRGPARPWPGRGARPSAAEEIRPGFHGDLVDHFLHAFHAPGQHHRAFGSFLCIHITGQHHAGMAHVDGDIREHVVRVVLEEQVIQFGIDRNIIDLGAGRTFFSDGDAGLGQRR